MRKGEAFLDARHPLSGIGNEVVELHLNVLDVCYEPAFDQMIEKIILASFNVDLHQMDLGDALLLQEIRCTDESHLLRCFGLLK